MLEFLKRAAPWLLAAVMFAGGYHTANNKWEAKVNAEYTSNLKASEDTRLAVQAEVNKVSRRFQDEMSSLEGSTDRIIADLQSDNKRLRVKVNTSGLTESDISRCFPNGRVELHESTSRSLIEITQKADLKEKALQDTIRRLQGAK
ncbi:Rz-like lysis protein [Escherichia phage pO91]|uniref:Rz-like lysis protein n=1 Tax=Escherichia phage pO91 TaxID=3072194 RepID=A0AA51R3S0_9CAUD|nr:Rz-like lysis protein [Escherichia phage pO91]